VARTTADCRAGLLFPFLVGIPISVLAFFATAFTSNGLGQAGGFVSIAIVCLYVLFASVGIAGLTTSIGSRLPSPADIERPWQATIRGSIVLELAFLLPLLGWFMLLPAALIIGSGAALRSIIKGMRRPKAAPIEAVLEANRDMSKETRESLGSNPGVA
jgi:hypothetical protein